MKFSNNKKEKILQFGITIEKNKLGTWVLTKTSKYMDYVATSFTGMIQSCLYALHLNTDFFATESGYIPLVSFEPEAILPTFCVLGWPVHITPTSSKSRATTENVYLQSPKDKSMFRVPPSPPTLPFSPISPSILELKEVFLSLTSLWL